MDEMQEAHDRDYRAKRKYEDAIAALTDVLEDETAKSRLSTATCSQIEDVIERLEDKAAHVVRVWD